MAKILLVEDDQGLASFVKTSLHGYGHEVDHIADGVEGLYWLTHESYSVAIIDWNLPNMEGPEICSKFRERGGQTPILMLTGKDKDSEVVKGLDSGADDYLAKPFKMDVLRARLRALLRRQPTTESNRIIVGEIEIDQLSSECYVGGTLIKLTRKEFSILELLMRETPKYFTSEEILRRVWPSSSEASPESIKSHIARMKARVAAVSPQAAEMVKSSYGLGYRIEKI